MDFDSFKTLVTIMVKTQIKKKGDAWRLKIGAFLRNLADDVDANVETPTNG